MYIYAIQCASRKYYIGKTYDVIKRYLEHQAQSPSHSTSWTSLYRPEKLVECRPMKSEHDENNLTKDYMKVYGIQNVRGGSYATVKLSEEVEALLERELIGNADKCYKCHLSGHFARDCKKTQLFRKRESSESSSDSDESSDSDDDDTKKFKCKRCGRKGHSVSKCYASTHLNGNSL
jgi:predicted GIY-YIG superfamily endonuclease